MKRYAMVIEHVRHRWGEYHERAGEHPIYRTACGRRFVPVTEYAYAPDRAAHLPETSRCGKCYG